MTTSLIELAREGTDKAHRELFALVSELVVGDFDQRTDSELAIFSEVILQLYDISQEKDRTRLAKVIAPHSNTPHDLACRMAEDEVGVATPILTSSPVFSREDLLSFIERLGKAHLQLLAHRSDLTPDLTDKLAEKGSKPIFRILAGNRKSQLSRETMQKLVAIAAEDNDVLDDLAVRTDLPPAVCRALLPLVNDETKKHLQSIIEGSLSQKQLDQIARLKLLRRQFDQQLQSTDMSLLWREAERARITLDELLILLLQDGRFNHAIELLSARGRTTQLSFKNAVFSGKLDLVLRTAAKARLQATTFALFAKARCDHLKIPSAQGSEWTAAYIKYIDANTKPKSANGDFQARRKSKVPA